MQRMKTAISFGVLGVIVAAALPGAPVGVAAASNSAGSASQPASVCQILTKAEITAATHATAGSPTEQKGAHTYNGRVYDQCTFPSSGNSTFIQLQLYHGTQTASGLASEAEVQTGCSRVSELGTAAYFCTSDDGMLILHGRTELDLGAGSPRVAHVPESALVKLATIANGHL
jgi:hypothetical protein